MPDTPGKLPDFVHWASFPFDGQLRVKALDPATAESPREDEDASRCRACTAPDDKYIWVSERWRVRATDQPTGLPMVLILEPRSHLDLGDLTNMLAAELGVMTVRLERAVRSLDGVARVHVHRRGEDSAHLQLWFYARPYGRLQLRGPFLPEWNDILPPVVEPTWRENLALVAAWLADFGGRALAEPPRIEWQAPATLDESIALGHTVSDAREIGPAVVDAGHSTPGSDANPRDAASPSGVVAPSASHPSGAMAATSGRARGSAPVPGAVRGTEADLAAGADSPADASAPASRSAQPDRATNPPTVAGSDQQPASALSGVRVPGQTPPEQHPESVGVQSAAKNS